MWTIVYRFAGPWKLGLGGIDNIEPALNSSKEEERSVVEDQRLHKHNILSLDVGQYRCGLGATILRKRGARVFENLYSGLP